MAVVLKLLLAFVLLGSCAYCKKIDSESQHIYNGEIAGTGPNFQSDKRYPYVAHYRWKEKKTDTMSNVCGAAIIHPKILLTAVHCIYDENTRTHIPISKIYNIIAGTYHLEGALESTYAKGELERIILHENFNLNDMKNDIAIMVLKNPLPINEYIRPIRLIKHVSRASLVNKTARFMGWGQTETGSSSSKLKYVDMKIYPNDECIQRQRKRGYKYYFDSNMICYLGLTKTESQGPGDSGSPSVFLRSKPDDDMLVGITSWTAKENINGIRWVIPSLGSIHTSVAGQRPWIERKLNDLGYDINLRGNVVEL